MAQMKKPAPKKPTAKPVAPSKKKPMPKIGKTPAMPKGPKPAIGADKDARKKFGPGSHNNGYTN